MASGTACMEGFGAKWHFPVELVAWCWWSNTDDDRFLSTNYNLLSSKLSLLPVSLVDKWNAVSKMVPNPSKIPNRYRMFGCTWTELTGSRKVWLWMLVVLERSGFDRTQWHWFTLRQTRWRSIASILVHTGAELDCGTSSLLMACVLYTEYMTKPKNCK